MADLSKNTQVVSNSVTENVSVCPLISPDSSCDILPSDLHKEPDVDLLGDGSSLQELIDTELAFRVSGNIEKHDLDDDDDDIIDDEALQCGAEVACSDSEEIYDVNTQFLMAERKSCFENLSTNATHFFTVIDEEVDADPDPDPEIDDDSRNDVNICAFDTIDVNGSNNDFEPFKSPVDITDSQQDSSSSPISPLDADIIKYSSTFGETIVDSASEEVGDAELVEPDDDDGLMGGPLIDKSDPQFDPTASNNGEPSPEEPSVNGTDAEVVPFQDFFTPIPEYVDDTLDLEFQQNLEITNGENGIDGHHLVDYSCKSPDDFESGEAAGKGELASPDIETDQLIAFTEEIPSNGAAEENGRDDYDLSVEITNDTSEEPIDQEANHDANHETDLEASIQEPLHDQPKDVDVCSTNTDSSSSASCSDLENNEMVTTSGSEKKIVKKKKKSEGGESTKVKKTKKTKKEEKENISVKSSFSKFDQLSKKTVLHVRSVDASKVQKQFDQTATAAPEITSNCRACGKQVFQMEQIKAERGMWHKNCFRCKECNKQLTVDNYSSNEGVLFCQPHFKELFKPKAVLEDSTEPHLLRRPKMIICENQPVELPPEVVRASDKPDLGLDELTSLNVKSRYQVFEKTDSNDSSLERSPSSVTVKRSPSILSKLARFQAKGMDIGVTDEAINNIPYEESSTSSEEELENENEDDEKGVIRANRKQRERPMSFNKMGDIKCRWETGQTSKDERREERKQEIQNIRSRLFMGKQGKMKEMYEQAVQDSERGLQKKDIDIRSEKAKSIKERFERGEVLPDDDDDEDAKSKSQKKTTDDDLGVFEEGISKKSRSLFLELDSKANQAPPIMSPLKSPTPREETKKTKEITPQIAKDIVRASDAVEDVKVETSEVFNKFKFFETYKEPEREKKKFRITPPRDGQVKEGSPETEIYRDPAVVRGDDKVEDEIKRTKTTSKMLSLFRQMEENASKEEVPEGPKPLKRFTPPPDYTHESENSEEEEESDEEEEEEEEEEEDDRDGNPNIVRASDKVEDEFLKQAATAARAKALRAKFERWEEKENKLNSSSSGCNLDFDQSDQPSIDSTKSLRAKFESLKSETEQPKERSRPKVNRFV